MCVCVCIYDRHSSLWCNVVKIVVIEGNGMVLFTVKPLFMLYTTEICLGTSLIYDREQ